MKQRLDGNKTRLGIAGAVLSLLWGYAQSKGLVHLGPDEEKLVAGLVGLLITAGIGGKLQKIIDGLGAVK